MPGKLDGDDEWEQTTMSFTPDLKKLSDALDPVKRLLAQAQSSIANEPIREQIIQLSARLEKVHAGLMASYPKDIAALQQRLAEMKASNEAGKAQLSTLLEHAEAAEAAKKAAVAVSRPAEVTLDPAAGTDATQ